MSTSKQAKTLQEGMRRGIRKSPTGMAQLGHKRERLRAKAGRVFQKGTAATQS